MNKTYNILYTCPVDHVGTSVFVRGWTFPQSERAPVIFIHDLGETADQYDRFAQSVTDIGHSVYGFDMRGHGQSGRRLGHIPSFQHLVNDLLQVVAWVRHKEKGRKPILIGQGIGSLVLLGFTKGHSKLCDSAAFICPTFALAETIQPWRRFLLRTAAEVFPTLMTPQWLLPVFTEPTAQQKHPRISYLLTNELLNALAQSKKLFNRLNIKTLMICPEEDRICKTEYLKKGVQKHKNSEKFNLIYKHNIGHSPLNHDEEYAHLLSDLRTWMEPPLEGT
ncbi:MAG: alpha/beta fold hydrolase [Oligoflexales bacterium]